MPLNESTRSTCRSTLRARTVDLARSRSTGKCRSSTVQSVPENTVRIRVFDDLVWNLRFLLVIRIIRPRLWRHPYFSPAGSWQTSFEIDVTPETSSSKKNLKVFTHNIAGMRPQVWVFPFLLPLDAEILSQVMFVWIPLCSLHHE